MNSTTFRYSGGGSSNSDAVRHRTATMPQSVVFHDPRSSSGLIERRRARMFMGLLEDQEFPGVQHVSVRPIGVWDNEPKYLICVRPGCAAYRQD